MARAPAREFRLLVLVSPDGAVESTVDHALREAREAATESDRPVAVDVRLVVVPGDTAAVDAALSRVEGALSRRPGGESVRSSVAVLELDAADQGDRVDAVRSRVDGPVARVVVGGVDLPVDRFRSVFDGASVELAPADRRAGRRRLLHTGGARRLVTVFALSYLFYLALGGFAGGLDLLTGAASAAVVALSLGRVALREAPTATRTGRRLARLAVFLPFLLWEVVKANVVIAYLILHPRLPIEPSMERVETDTSEDVERLLLANSITLTPGTLTVDVSGRAFDVHSLTRGSRADLAGGRLPRLVAWVFHGGDREDSPDDGGAGP